MKTNLFIVKFNKYIFYMGFFFFLYSCSKSSSLKMMGSGSESHVVSENENEDMEGDATIAVFERLQEDIVNVEIKSNIEAKKLHKRIDKVEGDCMSRIDKVEENCTSRIDTLEQEMYKIKISSSQQPGKKIQEFLKDYDAKKKKKMLHMQYCDRKESNIRKAGNG